MEAVIFITLSANRVFGSIFSMLIIYSQFYPVKNIPPRTFPNLSSCETAPAPSVSFVERRSHFSHRARFVCGNGFACGRMQRCVHPGSFRFAYDIYTFLPLSCCIYIILLYL